MRHYVNSRMTIFPLGIYMPDSIPGQQDTQELLGWSDVVQSEHACATCCVSG